MHCSMTRKIDGSAFLSVSLIVKVSHCADRCGDVTGKVYAFQIYVTIARVLLSGSTRRSSGCLVRTIVFPDTIQTSGRLYASRSWLTARKDYVTSRRRNLSMRYWLTIITLFIVMICCTSTNAQSTDSRTTRAGSWSTVTHTVPRSREYQQSKFHIPSHRQYFSNRRRFWSGAGIPIEDREQNQPGWVDRMLEQFKHLF